MGINFKPKTKGKIGDIIYPAYNNTNGFWEESRWDLVTKIDKKGNIKDKKYIFDFATVKAIELLKEYTNLKFISNKN